MTSTQYYGRQLEKSRYFYFLLLSIYGPQNTQNVRRLKPLFEDIKVIFIKPTN